MPQRTFTITMTKDFAHPGTAAFTEWSDAVADEICSYPGTPDEACIESRQIAQTSKRRFVFGVAMEVPEAIDEEAVARARREAVEARKEQLLEALKKHVSVNVSASSSATSNDREEFTLTFTTPVPGYTSANVFEPVTKWANQVADALAQAGGADKNVDISSWYVQSGTRRFTMVCRADIDAPDLPTTAERKMSERAVEQIKKGLVKRALRAPNTPRKVDGVSVAA